MPNIENDEVKQEKIVENLESISENTEETLELQKKEIEEQKEAVQEEEKAREEDKQEEAQEKASENAEKRKEEAEKTASDAKEEKKSPALGERFKEAIEGIKTGLGYVGKTAGFLLSESGSGGFSQMAKDTVGLMSKGFDFVKDFASNEEKTEGFKPASFKDQLKSFFTNRAKDEGSSEAKSETVENKTIQNIEETNKQVLQGASVDNSKQFRELRDDVKGTNGLLGGVFAKLSDILALNKEWRIDDEVANRRKAKFDQTNANNLGKNDLKNDEKKDSNLASALLGGAGAIGAGIAAKLAGGLLKGGKNLFKGALKGLLKTKIGKATALATAGAGALLKKALPFAGKNAAKEGAKEAGKAASKGGVFSRFKERFLGIKPKDAVKADAGAVKAGEDALKKGKDAVKTEAKPKVEVDKPKFSETPKTPPKARKFPKFGKVGGALGAGLSIFTIYEDVQAADSNTKFTEEQRTKAKGDAVIIEAGSALGGLIGGAGGATLGTLAGPVGSIAGGVAGGTAGSMAGAEAAKKFVETFPEASKTVGEGIEWMQNKWKEHKENAEYDRKMEEGKILVDYNAYGDSATYLGDLSKEAQEEYLKKHPEAVHKIMNSDFAKMQAGETAVEIAKKYYVEPEPYKINAEPVDTKSKIAEGLAKASVEQKTKDENAAHAKLAEKITEGQIQIGANKQPIIMDDHRITINNQGNEGGSNPFPIIMPVRDPAGMQVNGGY